MIQEKKRKIDSQDGGHLRFPSKTIKAMFDLQVAGIVLIRLQVSWPLGSGEAQNRFFKMPEIAWRFWLFLIYKFPRNFLSKFRVSWPFYSGEEAQNIFSRWLPWRISDRNDFSYFWSKSRTYTSTKFRINWPSVQEKRIIDLQSERFSYFLSTSCLDISYQVSSQLAFRFRRISAK